MAEPGLADRLRAELARRSIEVTFVDVGGRWGPAESWRRLTPEVRIVSFDADADECQRLQCELDPTARSITFVPAALGATAGVSTLYVTQDPACSSLYAPIPEVIAEFPELEVTRLVRTQEVELKRLDAWCAGQQTRPHAMKLDVQGAELDVLRGSVGVLSDVVMMELEVEFNRIYAEQPLFADVDVFLRAHGFRLWRLGQLVHYSRGCVSRTTVIQDLQAFDSRPVVFEAAGGEIFWAHAWYVAADVLTGASEERRLRAALASAAFGFEDLATLLGSTLPAA